MSDGIGRERLLSALRPGDESVWSIVHRLAGTPEPDRRRILRPHAEAGFTQARDLPDIAEREELDAALGPLTLYEIGRELGILGDADPPPVALPDLNALFGSEAFLWYSNAYLYFGIRFLAGRPELTSVPTVPNPAERDSNTRAFALEVPPPIGDTSSAQEALARFLELPISTETQEALDFLDDFASLGGEPDRFERWLRGLWPEADEPTAVRFARIAWALAHWAIDRSNFYLSLLPPEEPLAGADGEVAMGERGPDRPEGGWSVTNPIAGRIGLADIYWIARLLRADLTSGASVRYTRASWLDLLCFQAKLKNDAILEGVLRKAKEVLRSVFDLTCDVVQNAIEITEEKERRKVEPQPSAALFKNTAKWRQVFDEELDEIARQRDRRQFRGSIPEGGKPPSPPPPCPEPPVHDGWSQRTKTVGQPSNLIGLAFSGGGIRSATFNLGVLQGLQEFDLLRHIDYLSTVSGGGFIGSWLVANVKRSSHWLGRLTNWQESVAHLRRYSNYLAPSTGVLSADTWTMWAIWMRNAFLIQLTGATWLAALLLAALACQRLFWLTATLPPVLFGVVPVPGMLAALVALPLVSTLVYNLAGTRGSKRELAFSADRIRWLAVLPSWIGSFLIAGLLWGDATVRSAAGGPFQYVTTYSDILQHGWSSWWPLLAFVWATLGLIAFVMMYRRKWHAWWISTVSTAAFYLLLGAIMYLFRQWSAGAVHFGWYAFVFGPPLILVANTLNIVLFIGFCGRNSGEWLREWWTRFGTWLGIYGAVYLAVAMGAVLGPLWILSLLNGHWSIGWGTVAGWAGTVFGGLFAGNSSKTSGNGARSKSPQLELLGRVAGLLFIIGAVLAVATTLYALLVNIGTDDPVWSVYYWTALNHIHLDTILEALAVALACGTAFSWFFEINIFGLNQFYRNRLVRCYLGATRWAPGVRKPQPFTGFDGEDDMLLSELGTDFRGPFPILNCALNLGGSSDLSLHTRRSASFSLTPLRCGSDRPKVGYAPTKCGPIEFAGGVKLGQAVAVSGAAASPNMGYNTSPLVAFLLTMFNVRLGWWFPNPGGRRWRFQGLRFSLYYLIKELFGMADETNLFVNVSDGGHFENLGVYELVRRRCKVIVAADAECDESLEFGSLGNLVRVCDTDFGARIEIDVSSIRQRKEGHSRAHCTVGKITYSNGSQGYLIYLKASVTGDEDVGVTQYRSEHPSFPHETTADQFFSESQFESYRRLGHHVVGHALRGIQPGSRPVEIAEKLYDVWASAGSSGDAFLKHTETLDKIWERFRQSTGLNRLMDELTGNVGNGATAGGPVESGEEVCACLELVQLMENAFLDLRLDDFWDHPDNRGWAMLFMAWARSPVFRTVWRRTRRTFGIRFEYFCEERLGLERDRPIARV